MGVGDMHSFNDSKAATLAYNKNAIKMFGATAKINFPDQIPLSVHTTASTISNAIIDQDAVIC